MRKTFYTQYGKCVFDRISAAIALFFLLPFFLVLAALIKIDSNGPIFFRHQRVGHNFQKLRLLKFRSMVHEASKLGPSVTQGGDKRITRIGKILRNYKLDELPQLINVLLGEISVVGPRPEAEKYVNSFKEDYQIVLQVKPGITDYASVKFRNEEQVLEKYSDVEKGYIEEVLPQKIELYKEYIDSISFTTDIKIILTTLYKIVF